MAHSTGGFLNSSELQKWLFPDGRRMDFYIYIFFFFFLNLISLCWVVFSPIGRNPLDHLFINILIMSIKKLKPIFFILLGIFFPNYAKGL